MRLDRAGLPTPWPSEPSAADYQQALLGLLPGAAKLAAPGRGATPERLEFLIEIGAFDLGLARLLEGHLDACAILEEAGREPREGAVYAIWASGGPAATSRLETRDGTTYLCGSKPFCSGADLVHRALIHVDTDDTLVDIDMAAATARREVSFDCEWKAPGLAQIHTWTTHFEHVPVHEQDRVGSSGWYFRRPGFRHGALAPAACWAGGGIGLVRYAQREARPDEHAAAHLGAMAAADYAMRCVLRSAAQQVDADPLDSAGLAFPRALAVRHLVEQHCQDILIRFGRRHGPRPWALDARVARHSNELILYLRQNHAERDLAELGASMVAVDASLGPD